MEEFEQSARKRASAVRLLAAALAGAIGAFGMPAASHRAEPAPASTTATTAAGVPEASGD